MPVDFSDLYETQNKDIASPTGRVDFGDLYEAQKRERKIENAEGKGVATVRNVPSLAKMKNYPDLNIGTTSLAEPPVEPTEMGRDYRMQIPQAAGTEQLLQSLKKPLFPEALEREYTPTEAPEGYPELEQAPKGLFRKPWIFPRPKEPYPTIGRKIEAALNMPISVFEKYGRGALLWTPELVYKGMTGNNLDEEIDKYSNIEQSKLQTFLGEAADFIGSLRTAGKLLKAAGFKGVAGKGVVNKLINRAPVWMSRGGAEKAVEGVIKDKPVKEILPDVLEGAGIGGLESIIYTGAEAGVAKLYSKLIKKFPALGRAVSRWVRQQPVSEQEQSHINARREATEAWELKKQGKPEKWEALIRKYGYGQAAEAQRPRPRTPEVKDFGKYPLSTAKIPAETPKISTPVRPVPQTTVKPTPTTPKAPMKPSEPIKPPIETTAEATKFVKPRAVEILPHKKEILAEIDKAIKKAPVSTPTEGKTTIHFEIDGGANIENNKTSLENFRNAVSKLPEKEIIPRPHKKISKGTPHAAAKKEPRMELHKTPEGYFTDGRILVKGAEPPKGSKKNIDTAMRYNWETGKELPQETIDNILKAETEKAEFQHYAVKSPEVAEGVSESPIPSKIGEEDIKPLVVFKSGGKYFTYNQEYFNIIRNRFAEKDDVGLKVTKDLEFGIVTDIKKPMTGQLIAHKNGKPVAALMPIMDDKSGLTKPPVEIKPLEAKAVKQPEAKIADDKFLENRWNSSKLGYRVALLQRGNWVTKKGQLTKQAEKWADKKWSELSPAVQNVVSKIIAEDYNRRMKEVPQPEAKQPWEMTKEEYWQYYKTKKLPKSPFGKKEEPQTTANRAHLALIKTRTQQGKPVPPEVLQEYKGEKWADEAIVKQQPPPAEMPSTQANAYKPKEITSDIAEAAKDIKDAVKMRKMQPGFARLPSLRDFQSISQKLKENISKINQPQSDVVTDAFGAVEKWRSETNKAGLLTDWGKTNLDKIKVTSEQKDIITRYIDNPERYQEKFDQLSRDAKDMAQVLKNDFRDMWETANSQGILEAWRENYITHIYKDKPKKVLSVLYPQGGKLGTKFKFSKQRKIETLDEAEKFGLHPVTDPIILNSIYKYQLYKTIANKNLIELLKNLKREDGMPLIMGRPKKSEKLKVWENEYEFVNVPALSRYMYVGEAETGKAKTKTPMLIKMPVKADPEVAKILNNAFAPFVPKNKYLAIYYKARGKVKRLIMYNPLIHSWNIWSDVLDETNFNPLAHIQKRGKELYEKQDQTVVEAVEDGLQIQAGFSVAKDIRKAMHETPIYKTGIFKPISALEEWSDKNLWNRVVKHNQLGLYEYLRAKVMKKHPDWDKRKAGKLVATHINTQLGTLPHTWFTKWGREASSAALFARNWTISNIDLVVRAVSAGRKGLGVKALKPDQQKELGLMNAKHLAKGIFGLLALANLLQLGFLSITNALKKSKVIDGEQVPLHTTFQNESWKHWLDVDTGLKTKKKQTIYLVPPFFRYIRDYWGYSTQPGRTIYNKFEPILKNFIEALVNYSVWQNKNISQKGAPKFKQLKDRALYFIKGITPSSVFAGRPGDVRTAFEWVMPFSGTWIRRGAPGGKFTRMLWDYQSKEKYKKDQTDITIDEQLQKGEFVEAVKTMSDTDRYKSDSGMALRILKLATPLNYYWETTGKEDKLKFLKYLEQEGVKVDWNIAKKEAAKKHPQFGTACPELQKALEKELLEVAQRND